MRVYPNFSSSSSIPERSRRSNEADSGLHDPHSPSLKGRHVTTRREAQRSPGLQSAHDTPCRGGTNDLQPAPHSPLSGAVPPITPILQYSILIMIFI